MKTSVVVLCKAMCLLTIFCSSHAFAQDDSLFAEGFEPSDDDDLFADTEDEEARDESKFSSSFIVYARNYSLFGTAIMRDGSEDGALVHEDIGIIVERIRPSLSVWWNDVVGLEAAWDIIPLVGSGVGTGQGFSSLAVQNVGIRTLRLWDFDAALYSPTSGGWAVSHNLDRLNLKLGKADFSVQIGRQAFGHGSARMFPATDMFSPFGPGTIDTEFKRGVDGLRISKTLGEFHELEAYIIAHQPVEGEPIDLEQWMYIMRWRGVFPDLFDISLFAGSSYARPTAGIDLSTSVAGAAVYGESAVRFATQEQERTSVQATMGVDYRWESGLSTIAEVYYNNLGSKPPFTELFVNPSLARQVGELNYLGSWYAGLSMGYNWELLGIGGGYIQNLQDGSMLLTGNLSYDFAENVSVGLGALVPVGKLMIRHESSASLADAGIPYTYEPRSDFGLFPTLVFADVRFAF